MVERCGILNFMAHINKRHYLSAYCVLTPTSVIFFFKSIRIKVRYNNMPLLTSSHVIQSWCSRSYWVNLYISKTKFCLIIFTKLFVSLEMESVCVFVVTIDASKLNSELLDNVQ